MYDCVTSIIIMKQFSMWIFKLLLVLGWLSYVISLICCGCYGIQGLSRVVLLEQNSTFNVGCLSLGFHICQLDAMYQPCSSDSSDSSDSSGCLSLFFCGCKLNLWWFVISNISIITCYFWLLPVRPHFLYGIDMGCLLDPARRSNVAASC